MRKNSSGITETISALTVAVLFAVILVLVVFSARSYQFAQGNSEAAADRRAVLSYMVNCVRNSGSSEICIEDRSGTECLVIADGSGSEQRFYEHEGKLMEEYCIESAALRPQDALVIGDVGSLDLEIDENGLLSIRTGKGSSCVNIKRQRF